MKWYSMAAEHEAKITMGTEWSGAAHTQKQWKHGLWMAKSQFVIQQLDG